MGLVENLGRRKSVVSDANLLLIYEGQLVGFE